jgi:hypothetical protein
MNRSVHTIVAIVILTAASGHAQTTITPARTVLAVNTGYQATSNDFHDEVMFRGNAEDGEFDTDYHVTSGPTLDVAGSRQIWRWLGVGGGVSRFSRSTPATLSGSVPHPFFFNRPRTIDGSISGLGRDELSLHAQLRAVLPVQRNLQLSLFGGPSWFRVRQGIVTDISYDEEYPYDQAFFREGQTRVETESALGFNAGADVAFFFARRTGIGASIQLSSATVNLVSADGGVRSVKAGGIQTGAGLRLRF